MRKKLFELENGFKYTCSGYGDSEVFMLEDNVLKVFAGEQWREMTHIDQRWSWTEMPDQRDLCLKCSRSCETKKNAIVFMGKFYTGLWCKHCKIMNEGPDVPKMVIE